MTCDAHTPTPWNCRTGLIRSGDDILCVQPQHPENGKNWANDSEFIVRAVNSHDELVKALADLISITEPNPPDKPGSAWAKLDAARAALAAADGSVTRPERGDVDSKEGRQS